MVDIALLDTVIGIIEADPSKWNQDSWRCDTGMCVAGWVGQLRGQWIVPSQMLNNDDAKGLAEYVYAEETSYAPVKLYPVGPDDVILRAAVEAERVELFAARHLGLNENQADALFYHGNELEDIKDFRDQLAANPDAHLDNYDDEDWED